MEVKATKIELVSINSLVPHPKNMNKHSPDQIDRLSRLIEYQGFRNPIVVQVGTNLVVAGHGRIDAARKLGIKQVPVTYQEFESEAQLYAYMTSDNAIASWAELDLSMVNSEMLDMGPDFDIDMLGIKDFAIEPIEKFDANGDADDLPNEVVSPVSRKGDIWILGQHRLMCGSSIEYGDMERLMNGNLANHWLTDPPYGVAYKSKGTDKHTAIQNDDKPLDEMYQFWKQVAENAYLCTDNESSYYWFACQGGDQMMMMMMSISDANWKVRHELIWKKDRMVLSRCDYHYKHEPILYGWKKDGKHNWYSDRKQVSVLEFDRPKTSDIHPTMKPVALCKYLLENNTKRGDIVLETFNGSGTTLMACTEAERKCYAIEIEEKYVDATILRWQNYTGMTAKLESTGQTYEELKVERNGNW